jgi:hypothetical protein
MAGKIVDRLPHSCGASRALNVFENEDGSYSGFCFSCKTRVSNPYSDKEEGYVPKPVQTRTPEQVKKELEAVRTKFPTRELKDRAISKEVCEYLGIKVGVSQENGHDITSHFYPYWKDGNLEGYKVRLVEDKKFFGMGNTRDVEPFGYDLAMKHATKNSKVFVVEGELEVASVIECFKEHGNHVPSVISIPNGAGSVGKIAKYIDNLKRSFKHIVLVMDNDDAGNGAVEDFLKLCPEVLIAKLPLKDPNDMMKAGRSAELFKAIMWDAKPPTTGKSVRSSDRWEEAEYVPEFGIEWTWPTVTKATRGVRRGEVYYFGGGVKIGKSVLVNELAVNILKRTDTNIFMVKPEEPIGGTLKRLAGTASNAVFYDPAVPFDRDKFEEGKKVVGDRVILYDTYQDVKWEDVKNEIRYNVMVLGCKDVFLDPLTCFTVGMEASKANEELVKIASQFAALAKELDFTGYCFCHLNNPSTGKEHNRGGAVLSSQFAGSRAMARFCHLMLGLQGNKDPELPEEERNMRQLVFLEDRNFGESIKVDLFFNKETGRLLEPDQHLLIN